MDTYYSEDEYLGERLQGLFIIPKDGPRPLITDEPFTLHVNNKFERRVVQESTSELYGDSELTITYRYVNDDWMIEDRGIETE
ncbi:hypothetical protein [Salisediminibacterium selenitireducens]|uniref:Uncharacterized protein n=1 Tax=Bacillus selenitireducens (strain ATCC 700615 / DSM 15326 / MLS10) TaxID=439292 RepID=D6XVZ3_BACIE|nr:hypothetical protein [Salisediminibacterium selenitireducens]ADH97766.1 hypothetical protein Bsel_0220 [[Bacillus] selenitireducens MLS10]